MNKKSLCSGILNPPVLAYCSDVEYSRLSWLLKKGILDLNNCPAAVVWNTLGQDGYRSEEYSTHNNHPTAVAWNTLGQVG